MYKIIETRGLGHLGITFVLRAFSDKGVGSRAFWV